VRGADLAAVAAVVPGEIEAFVSADLRREQLLCERRLADLTRAGEKDHLAGEVGPDRRFKIAVI
jgi:hypothetical protein